MKIVYVTSYSFPSTKAEPYHVKSLARAFTEHIGKNLLLVVYGTAPTEFDDILTFSTKKRKRLRTLFYFFWFPQFVRQHQLKNEDIVFLSNDPYLLLVFIFWRKVLGYSYKICADWHLLFEDWKDTVIARYCDYMVSTTKRLKDITVSKCGVPPEKILVAYGGVDENLLFKKEDVSKQALREELGLPQDAFLIGYAGTFRSLGLEKGLTTMLRALPELPSHMHMVFVGGTREQIPEYEVLADELGVKERCTIISRQPFEKIIRYELAMDVLVIPYPDQHHFRDYGFPIKVWEYMATGRPIVYSNLEIIDEVLHGRGTAFTPDSPQSLRDTILSIYDNFPAIETASKKNMIDIEDYTWNKKAQKILTFFGYTKKEQVIPHL